MSEFLYNLQFFITMLFGTSWKAQALATPTTHHYFDGYFIEAPSKEMD